MAVVPELFFKKRTTSLCISESLVLLSPARNTQMNEAANQTAPFIHTDRESGRLLQRISDAIKRPFYGGASGLHGDDDRHGNSSIV
jgi:hypothetical protein